MAFALPSPEGRTITVLGGGVLGRRIACSWAAGGYDVVIRDPSPEQRAAALQYCETSMSQYSDNPKRGTVKALDDLPKAVEKAWLVIEAVPERLSLKISTFEELERITKPDTILASNSSSYKSREMVEERQASTKRRILNMHYYMPPANMIVELMTDGETDESIFPFLVEHLSRVGMHPYVARKESTGLIFNRLWAAIKREVLYIIAEGVADPEQIDKLWVEMWSGSRLGPVAMMDNVGLDTVSFIEQHYVQERGLPNTAVDFLKKYIEEGRLGAKSAKGGLLPPAATNKAAPPQQEAIKQDEHSPQLFFLDIGLAQDNVVKAGRILVGGLDGQAPKTLVSGLQVPDGIDISPSAGKLFWTSMEFPTENDGAIFSSNLDGTDSKMIVPQGHVHTPKQLKVDEARSKLYFSDREGLRVFRSNFDGSDLEVLIQAGNWQNEKLDATKWCVGITVSHKTGKFYWTQKGHSKAFEGRIFQANIDFLPGENASNRTDVECLLQNLPEPIDLEIDEINDVFYWTDRGELPFGNSVNRAPLAKLSPVTSNAASVPGKDYELIVRNLHEAIGLKLDPKRNHLYVTDLGGALYRFDLDGNNKTLVHHEEKAAFAGLTMAFS